MTLAEHIKKQKNNYKRKMRRWRREMVEEDGRCHYCAVPLTFETSTLDHKRPLFRFGKTTRDNMVLACRSCNVSKGNKPYGVFIKRRLSAVA